MRQKVFSWEPAVSFRDCGLIGERAWDEIDMAASTVLGSRGLAVPSVRVGIAWALEYLGYKRHCDHVLVPRFTSRCVLNAINRVAFPVEVSTPKTRLAIVVHQYGFKQQLEEVHAKCVARSLLYIEDSPFGLEEKEELGPGSLAKFIGFSKVLPVLKGGFAISDDKGLIQYLKDRRAESSFWSWPLLLMMMMLRHREHSVTDSVLAAVAYELYFASGGDNAWFRSNLGKALERIQEYTQSTRERLALTKEKLGTRVFIQEGVRLAYVVPYNANGNEDAIQSTFSRHGFDSTSYHFDVNRNVFDPDYRRVFLIPLNPRIPLYAFQSLVHNLSKM